MKKHYQTILFLALLAWPFAIQGQSLVTHESSHDMERTLQMLKTSIENLDVNLMQEIDHSENAEKVDKQLEPVHVLLFGNPEVGTQLMQSNPEVAIELPLKILVYEKEGKTFIAYQDPVELEGKYNLHNQRNVLHNMRAMMEKIVGSATTGDGQRSKN